MNQQIKALLIMLFAFTTHWVQAQSVAKVGDTEYATIEEAIAAWGPGKTLTLLADVTTTSTVIVEVTNSTQCWTLNLGDYTWTASGCNAFKLNATGVDPISQNPRLIINANQSGGITARGNYAIQYTDDKKCSDSRGYRPGLYLNGGTYNASYIVYYGTYAFSTTKTGASVYMNKSADGTEPIFNGNFGLSKCPVTVNAGYFNGTQFTVYRVSSTADPRIYGGHFKTYSAFPVPGNDKGIVFGSYKVFVKSDASIDMTNGAPATYEAKATKTLLLTTNQSKDYTDYIYYEKADDALNKYSSGNIEIILNNNVTATQNKAFSSGTLTIDASAENCDYTGTITLNNNNAIFVIKFPEGEGHYGVNVSTGGTLHVEETVADGIVTRTYSRIGTVSNPEAKVDNTSYSTVYDAFYAIDGTKDNKTIVLQKDVTNAGIITNGTATGGDGKTIATFDLNGKSIGVGSVGAGNNADYTLTIIDSSEGKTGTVTNTSASLFILGLTGINDYSGTYTLKVQAGTWMFDPSNVTVNGETYNMVDEGYVAHDNGNGTWTVGEIPMVAAIGETRYPTLQAAVNAAQQMGGKVTVNIIDNISEETVTINEVANFKLTIDGKKDDSSNYTVDAVIAVDGLRGNGGSTTNGASVTLQNIDFVKTTATDGIQATAYPHDLTIQDCTYKGFDNDKWFLNASVNCPLYGVTVKNVTVENARLIYANMAEDAVFENITATNNVKVGFNVKTSGTALIKDCQVATGKYAFRDITDAYEGTFTLQDNTFISTTSESDEGAIVNRGGAVGTAHINVVSGTYTGPVKVLSNKEGVLAISGGYFSEEFPQDYIAADLVAQGKVCVPATNMEGYFTIGDPHYVAQIGETKYVTLPAALEAANNGEAILLLDDIDMGSDYVSINKAVTINGDGHSITSSAAAAVEVSGTGDVTISNTEINATSGRGVQVGNVAHYSGNLTINEGTVITVAKRGINVLDVDEGFALNVNGSIIQTNMADPTTTYTIGEESRGINFSNDPLAFTANITNSEIRGFSYCTNIYSGAESLTLNITGGKSYGRDVVNNWGKNNTFNLDGVEVHGLNNQTGPTEAFACIVENAGSANNIYNINNCQFIATLSDDAINTANTSASEYLIDLRGNNTKVVITGTTSYTTNAAEKGGFIEYEPYIDNNTIMMDETAANTFANAFKEYKIEETEVAPGYIVTKKVYVAQIGEVKYETLEAAWAAVQDGETITLLADCAGNGIKAPQGKFSTGVTIDFDGHTYTMDGELVGSTGTETQAFQLLKDNKITFKNGTIYSEKAKMLVQNYSDLTLEGMTLTLANENYSSAYTLSNNNGNVVIDGTTINANTGGGFAFDVCRYASYPSVNVTVTGDSEINGNVEVSASGSDAKDGFTLMLESGTINGDLVIDPTAATAMVNTPEKAQVMENDDFGQAAPYGFKWESIGEGVSKLVAMEYVAQIGNVKYYSLADAVSAVPTDGTETTITMIANEMIDVVGYAITIPATKNVVLDLNGFEVVGTASEGNTSALITNLGTLTIKDSSDTNKDGTGTGKLMSGATTTWTWDGSDDYAGSYASNLIRNEKNLIVESGLLYNMSSGSAAYAIDNYYAGNVTINGGNIDAAKASAIRMFYVNGGSLSVTDGVIGRYNSDDDCTYMGIQVMSGTNVNVSVTGGTIDGNYSFYANNTGGDITISGGTFNSYVMFSASVPNISITDGAFGSWVGAYGDQTKFISGGIYAGEVEEEYIADGYILTDNTDEATKEDYPYTVRTGIYVAKIGEVKYETLAEAIAVVGDNETITMLCDVDNAGGLSVPSGKNFTVDFDGHTYTLNKPGAGSTGTETIGFQLLKNSTIVFKNGTIDISEDNLTEAILPAKNIKRIIQNYANLTLEDMTIDGTNQFGGNTYVVSFNNGTSSIIGNTSIIAGETGQKPIMDIDINNSYTGTNVTINTTGVIGGDIETSAISQEKADACSLTITNADVLGTITKGSSYDVPVSVSGGIYDEEVQEEFCAVGYVCVPTDNNRYTVKTKEDAGIFDLVDWEDYPYTEEKEATQVTYTRKFDSGRIGKYQAWIVPFDYEITEEDAENFDFYKINLIASSKGGGEITDDKQIYVNILKVGAGTVLKANRPYEVKPLYEFDGDNAYVFKAQNVTLKVPDTSTSRLHTETSRLAFDFYANYTYGHIANSEPAKCFCLAKAGTLMWLKSTTNLGAYRWYSHVTDKFDDDDYSNWTFVMGEEDPTGINYVKEIDMNEVEGIYTPGGVKIENPTRGVNIIKFNDGRTKKVYIK